MYRLEYWRRRPLWIAGYDRAEKGLAGKCGVGGWGREKAGYSGGNGVLKYSILLFKPDFFK